MTNHQVQPWLLGRETSLILEAVQQTRASGSECLMQRAAQQNNRHAGLPFPAKGLSLRSRLSVPERRQYGPFSTRSFWRCTRDAAANGPLRYLRSFGRIDAVIISHGRIRVSCVVPILATASSRPCQVLLGRSGADQE